MLEAFAAGAGGRVVHTSAPRLEPGAAAFYGVRPEWLHLWQQAVAQHRRRYYLDNAWFDVAREKFFRVGINAVQSWREKASDGRRLRELGIKATHRAWFDKGSHIVVCRQSDEFMRTVAGWQGGAIAWQQDVLNTLKGQTDRLIVVRIKGETRPLQQELIGARALVTHSSAAAAEALIAGVPVIVTDHQCAAAELGARFEDIENDARLFLHIDEVQPWAQRLADSQWTLEEMRQGAAWKAINA